VAKALAPARENRSRSPASRRTGPAHPGQSLPTAIKGPITADSLLAVQRTAGNRAAAALVTVQADSAKPATATITHDSVYSEHFKLITDIGLLNQKVMSSIRSHWLESLSRSMAPLADAGDKYWQLSSIHDRYITTRQEVDEHVARAKKEWPRLKALYEDEMKSLENATGWKARARGALRSIYDDTSHRVFIAWPYLTTEDLDPLINTIQHGTHLQNARQQDEAEKAAKEKVESKLPQFTSFRIRSLAGGQLSVGPAGLDVTTFQFEEVGPGGRSAYLTFAASGGSIGLRAGATGPGTWTDFDTDVPMRIEHFDGALGNITTGGAYIIIGAGWTSYTFKPLNKPWINAKGWGASFGLGGGGESVNGVWSVRGL